MSETELNLFQLSFALKQLWPRLLGKVKNNRTGDAATMTK